MSRIQPLTNAAAPAESKPLLEAVEKKLGKAPNLFRTLAHSPAALQAYLGTSESLGAGSLSAQARELIALAVGEANGCDYCLAAHTTIGGMVGLNREQMEQARRGTSDDPKLAALLKFTTQVVEARGRVGAPELEAFKGQGWTDGDAIEVVANVALNTLTNYVNHLADTEVDFPAAPALSTT